MFTYDVIKELCKNNDAKFFKSMMIMNHVYKWIDEQVEAKR